MWRAYCQEKTHIFLWAETKAHTDTKVCLCRFVVQVQVHLNMRLIIEAAPAFAMWRTIFFSFSGLFAPIETILNDAHDAVCRQPLFSATYPPFHSEQFKSADVNGIACHGVGWWHDGVMTKLVQLFQVLEPASPVRRWCDNGNVLHHLFIQQRRWRWFLH